MKDRYFWSVFVLRRKGFEFAFYKILFGNYKFLYVDRAFLKVSVLLEKQKKQWVRLAS